MSKQKILIVDDEPLVLGVMHRLFNRSYELFLCTSIAQARGELAAHEDLDLVICDYQVSEYNGLQFLNDVRKSRPSMKRVLMSGKLTAELTANAFNNEIAHRIITKPWINGEMMEVIHEILNRSERNLRHMPQPNVTMQGDLKGMAVSDLVCLLTSHQKSGILVLEHDRLPNARIYLRNGRVVDAVEIGNGSESVFDKLLARCDGTFQFFENGSFSSESAEIPIEQQIIMI